MSNQRNKKADQNADNIDLSILPPGLRVILDILGIDEGLKVLNEHQGQCFSIPQEPNKQHRVTKVFGLELAKHWAKKCDELGTSEYQIPMASKALAQLRNAEIVRLHNAGMSVVEIAKKFKITRQWAFGIIADAEAPTQQLDWLKEA